MDSIFEQKRAAKLIRACKEELHNQTYQTYDTERAAQCRRFDRASGLSSD